MVVIVEDVDRLCRRLVEAVPGGRAYVLDGDLLAAVGGGALRIDLDPLGGRMRGDLASHPEHVDALPGPDLLRRVEDRDPYLTAVAQIHRVGRVGLGDPE